MSTREALIEPPIPKVNDYRKLLSVEYFSQPIIQRGEKMSVSFGHGLELTYFRVQKQTSSGGWTNVSTLNKDQKYRFKIRFKNINSTAYMPPITEPHAFLELGWIQITEASYARFYSSSSYTGTPATWGHSDGGKIYPDKSEYYYIYFIWKSPGDIPMPPPGVKITVDIFSAVYKGRPNSMVPPFI